LHLVIALEVLAVGAHIGSAVMSLLRAKCSKPGTKQDLFVPEAFMLFGTLQALAIHL
jgi:hypothetical protein